MTTISKIEENTICIVFSSCSLYVCTKLNIIACIKAATVAFSSCGRVTV